MQITALNESTLRLFFAESGDRSRSVQELLVDATGYAASALDALVWLPNLSSVTLLGINHMLEWDKLLLLGNLHIISLFTSLISAYIETRALVLNIKWSLELKKLLELNDSAGAERFLDGFFSSTPGLFGTYASTLVKVAGKKAVDLAKHYFDAQRYNEAIGVLLVGMRIRRSDLILRALCSLVQLLVAIVAVAIAVLMPHTALLLAGISLLFTVIWIITFIGESYKQDSQQYSALIEEAQALLP